MGCHEALFLHEYKKKWLCNLLAKMLSQNAFVTEYFTRECIAYIIGVFNTSSIAYIIGVFNTSSMHVKPSCWYDAYKIL